MPPLPHLAVEEIKLSTAPNTDPEYEYVFYGEVIDFLDFYWGRYHWPAFNVADSFITAGVSITVYYLIKAKGQDPFARR